MKTAPTVVSDYGYLIPLETRWSDNDVYGHVNNVAFYSFFDTAINRFLIERGGLDLERSSAIALVVESGCHFHSPIAYPQPFRAGVRVDKLSQRAVTWGVAVFAAAGTNAVAHGHVVHVFVDRASRAAVPIPDPMRKALETLARGAG